jgi:hypothetical protein
MQDQPSPAAILDLVIPQLSSAQPTTPERARFEQRVIVAALQLVQREVTLAPATDAAEQERLQVLLGDTGDLLALNRSLCARIRDGSLTLASPGVAAHLRATAMEKLAVDQPNYAAYKRALTTKD